MKDVLKEANVNPVGQLQIENVDTSETLRFRLRVPVAPTVTLPDYRAIRVPLEVEPVTDTMIERGIGILREKHVVLKELEEPRPAAHGDQLTLTMTATLEGEQLFASASADDEALLVLEPGHTIYGLYEGLLGITVGEDREIMVRIPEDHVEVEMRNKDVLFRVHAIAIHERMLPDDEELSTLENLEGDVSVIRQYVQESLDEYVRVTAEQKLVQTYTEKLIAQSEFDIPDVIVMNMLETMLQEQGYLDIESDEERQRRENRGEALNIPPELVRQFRPLAEERVKSLLALQEMIQQEALPISQNEIQEEVYRELMQLVDPETQTLPAIQTNANITQALVHQATRRVLDRKLYERIVAIATGQAQDQVQTPTVRRPATDDTIDPSYLVAAEPISGLLESAPQVLDIPEPAETTADEPPVSEESLAVGLAEPSLTPVSSSDAAPVESHPTIDPERT